MYVYFEYCSLNVDDICFLLGWCLMFFNEKLRWIYDIFSSCIYNKKFGVIVESKIILFTPEFDTDEETDKLLQKQYKLDQNVDIPELNEPLVRT